MSYVQYVIFYIYLFITIIVLAIQENFPLGENKVYFIVYTNTLILSVVLYYLSS